MTDKFVVPEDVVIGADAVTRLVREEVREFFAWWQDPKNFGGINDTRTSRDYLTVYLGQRFGEPPATKLLYCPECTVKDGFHGVKCPRLNPFVGPSRGEPEVIRRCRETDVRVGMDFHSVAPVGRPFVAQCRLLDGHDGPHKWDAEPCTKCSCASCGAVRDFVAKMAETVWAVGYWGHTQHGDSVYVSATGGLRDAAQAVVVAARKVTDV